MRKVITKQFILDEKNDKELSDLGLLSYSIRYRKMENDCDSFNEREELRVAKIKKNREALFVRAKDCCEKYNNSGMFDYNAQSEATREMEMLKRLGLCFNHSSFYMELNPELTVKSFTSKVIEKKEIISPHLDTELISNTLIKNGFAIEYINEGDFLVFCNKKEGACIVSYKPNEDGADIEFNDPSLICELRDYIQFKDDSGYYFPVLYGYYEYYIFVANSFMDNNAKFIPPTSYKKINHPYIFFTQLGYKLVEEFDTGRMIFMKN